MKKGLAIFASPFSLKANVYAGLVTSFLTTFLTTLTTEKGIFSYTSANNGKQSVGSGNPHKYKEKRLSANTCKQP